MRLYAQSFEFQPPLPCEACEPAMANKRCAFSRLRKELVDGQTRYGRPLTDDERSDRAKLLTQYAEGLGKALFFDSD
eukprot:12663588-Alexandrium_andersonii.AAC.1